MMTTFFRILTRTIPSQRIIAWVIAVGVLFVRLMSPTLIHAAPLSPSPITPIVPSTASATLAPLVSATPMDTGLVKMSVDAGFQGHFRSDDWTPLLITVSNDGPDLSGQLVVNAGNGVLGLADATYSAPLTLPTHSSKRLIIYAIFNGGTQQTQVDLVDNDGLTRLSSMALLAPMNTDDSLYVVVDDSPTGSIDLTVARPIAAVGYQARWSLDNFPTMADAWRSVDVLLLSNTDSGRLVTEQRRALADWINRGGHLIVTGGPDWQRTQAGVVDMLPLMVTGTATVSTVGSLAIYANQSNDSALLRGTIIAAQGTLTNDAQQIVTQAIMQNGSPINTPLIIRRYVGSGLVDYMSIDPGLEPIRSWAKRGALWQSLLADGANRPGWARGIANNTAANDAASSALGLRFPDVLQVAGFLLLYILLIGPVNYVALRLLKRLEWAWLTIPLLIVIATAIAYFTGFDLRGTQPILNRLAIIQIWPNQSRAQIDGLLGIISPRRNFYDVTVGNGLNIRPLPLGNSGLGLTGNGNVKVVEKNSVDLGDSYHLFHVPVDAGLAATFVNSGSIPAPALDGSATITLVSDGTATIQGVIHNYSSATINDSLVLAFNNALPLGTLAPGETRQFSYTLNPVTQLARALPSDAATYITNYNYLYNNNGKTMKTLIDLIEESSSLANDSVSNLNQRLKVERQTFLNGLIDNSELGGARGTSIYFIGWGDSLPFSISLDNVPSNNEDTALYAVQLSSNIQSAQAISQPLILPPGLQSWRSIPTTLPVTSANLSQMNGTPYSIYLTVGDKAAYEFEPLNGLHLATINQLLITLHSFSVSNASISLWDWPRSQWIALDLAQLSTEGQYMITDPADLARFVGMGNQVRVEITASAGQAAFDRLDTILSGTLTEAGTPEVVGF